MTVVVLSDPAFLMSLKPTVCVVRYVLSFPLLAVYSHQESHLLCVVPWIFMTSFFGS